MGNLSPPASWSLVKWSNSAPTSPPPNPPQATPPPLPPSPSPLNPSPPPPIHPSTPYSPSPRSPKTILITRAAGQSSQFADLLTAQGAEVIEMPALEIRPPADWGPLDGAIAQLPSCHWLLLTSANAVNFFYGAAAAPGQRQP